MAPVGISLSYDRIVKAFQYEMLLRIDCGKCSHIVQATSITVRVVKRRFFNSMHTAYSICDRGGGVWESRRPTRWNTTALWLTIVSYLEAGDTPHSFRPLRIVGLPVTTLSQFWRNIPRLDGSKHKRKAWTTTDEYLKHSFITSKSLCGGYD